MAAKKEEEKKGDDKPKIRNPKIVLEPEAVFHKRAKGPFDELVASLPEDVKWLTKDQVHQFWQAALDRDLVPEVWDPLWEKLPKLSKEKFEKIGDAVVMAPKDAYEHANLRAIEIGMCYSRLRSALEHEWPAVERVESDLNDFFKNDYLSDVSLVHPHTNAVYK